MDLSTEILIAVLIVGSVLLQFGEHRYQAWRLLAPLAIVAYFATRYLSGIPTQGNDLLFEIAGAAIGIVTGVVAALLMGVRRDAKGDAILTAGVLYAGFWIVVFGARLAFAFAATNSHEFDRQLGLFSYQHQITGAAAWAAFFIFQAVLMVVVRSLIVGARVLMARPALLSRAA